MAEIAKTRTVFKFRNTCHNCFNDIEFPLLGDFSNGEVIMQTNDAKDFYIAELIDNSAYNYIAEFLCLKGFQTLHANSYKILTLIADKIDGREFTTRYPICPVCKAGQRNFNDNIRTTEIELSFATWKEFESLSQEGKLSKLYNVISL